MIVLKIAITFTYELKMRNFLKNTQKLHAFLPQFVRFFIIIFAKSDLKVGVIELPSFCAQTLPLDTD